MNKPENIIEQKFEIRFDLSSNLQNKIFEIPYFLNQKSERWKIWMAAASILFILSFHFMKMNSEKNMDQEDLIEYYSESDAIEILS